MPVRSAVGLFEMALQVVPKDWPERFAAGVDQRFGEASGEYAEAILPQFRGRRSGHLQMHLLPDTLDADAFGFPAGGAEETLDGLLPRLTAERESLVMHG